MRCPGLLHVVLAVESRVPAASRCHCYHTSKGVQGRDMESEERVERADKMVSCDLFSAHGPLIIPLCCRRRPGWVSSTCLDHASVLQRAT